MKKMIDLVSAVTLLLTLILFLIAAFEHGFTRDLLLEAGVFLVSVKLIVGNYKTEQLLKKRFSELESLIERGNSGDRKIR
jgi:hypothetical protein